MCFKSLRVLINSRPFVISNGPRREETCLQRFANNKDADQPAHPRSLVIAFVIRLLESSIPRLATREISIFYLVSVAGEADLNLTLSVTPKTGFLAARPKSHTV